MCIEVLIQGQCDGGDFLAGVFAGTLFQRHIDGIEALGYHLLALGAGGVDFADNPEADAQQQQGREYDAHGGDGHAQACAVVLFEVGNFGVDFADGVARAGRDVECLGRGGADVPFLTSVLGEGIRSISSHGRYGNRVDKGQTVSIVDADPVGFAGLELDVGMECAEGVVTVGPEQQVLAFPHLGALVAKGYTRHSLVVGVGGDVHARDFERREVGVEQFDPGRAVAVFVDNACLVLYHHLIDAQPFAGLRRHGTGTGCKG